MYHNMITKQNLSIHMLNKIR